MKHKIFSVVAFGLFMGLLPISCTDLCNGPCGCNPVFTTPEMSVRGFSSETLFRTDNNEPINPSLFYHFNALYKAFWVSDTELLSQTTSEGNGPWFTQKAVACSVLEAHSKETLQSLRVINKRVTQLPGETLIMDQDITNKFFITETFQVEYEISDFLKTSKNFFRDENLYLKFRTPPQGETELLFVIEIELSDGEMFTLDNETMRIK
ncbi:hypothetical protein [Pararhodonellum marinum]|uniref:hypothetical protein n=1 Tax=Pararhodonellum marinum TaxID=2755358 RepID=UPI00188F90E9|nr:hypothetical protein [Pararhodonellum marinum]